MSSNVGSPIIRDTSKSTAFKNLGADFSITLGKLNILLGIMSKNSLARVSKKIAGYPLEDENIKLIQPDEEKAYDLSVKLFHTKIEMMFEQLREQKTADEKAEQENKNE